MEDKIPTRTSKIMVWAGVGFTATRSASSLATPVHTSSSLVLTLVSRNQTFVALFPVTPPNVHSSWPTASYVFDFPRLHNRDGYDYPREINRHLPVHLHLYWTIRLTIPFSFSSLSLCFHRLHRPIQGLRFCPISFCRGGTSLRGSAVSFHSSSSSSLARRICHCRIPQGSQNGWTAQRAPCQN
jgi:hypothetical protein